MTIAYWCVLAAALIPYLFIFLAKFNKGYKNCIPRDYLEKLTGWRKRAYWAQLNSFEIFPIFASGVIIAHISFATQWRIDMLSLVFVVSRLFYGFFYMADKSTLRSLTWFLGFGCTIALYIIAY